MMYRAKTVAIYRNNQVVIKFKLTLALVALSNVWPLNRIVLSVAAISNTPATDKKRRSLRVINFIELTFSNLNAIFYTFYHR